MAYRNSGVTLIEVVVSIGLLATLLATSLTIRDRHVRQIRLARNVEQAVEALDQQIATWFAEGEQIPTETRGEFTDNALCFWQTTRMPIESSNPNWPAVKVRVEAVSTLTQEVLVAVELIDSLPDEAPRR